MSDGGFWLVRSSAHLVFPDIPRLLASPSLTPRLLTSPSRPLILGEEPRKEILPLSLFETLVFSTRKASLTAETMAANVPLTTEAIALTEKKMDMALDDIIKMSKKTTLKGKRPPRASNKSRAFLNGHASQGNLKVQQFMESRSSIRQGVLAQRRSNSQGNQFPLATKVARKAAAVPIRNRAVNRNKPRIAATPVQRNAGQGGFTGKDKEVPKKRAQTLDALFAGMKEQRMRVMSQQMSRGHGRQTAAQSRPQQQQWGRGVAAPGRGSGRRFGNFAR